MSQCMQAGCQAAATCSAKLCVPVMNRREGPLAFYIGLQLCDAHQTELSTDSWLGEQISQQPGNLRGACEILARGAKVHYDQAYFQRLALDSDEWRTAAAMLGKKAPE